MTLVTDDAWVPKAKKRKAHRDAFRDRVFAEMGLTKGAQAQDCTGAPQDGLPAVATLLQITAKGDILDAAQKAMIPLALGQLQAVGLGLGAMGATAATQAHLDAWGMEALRKGWFASPAFFD
jgi:hypothetical protein